MFLERWKTTAATALALAVGVLTASVLALAMPRPPDRPPAPDEASTDDAKKAMPLPTRAEVRDALKGWWDRLESLEFREQTIVPGPDDRQKPGSSIGFVDYAQAPGNRRAVRHGAINAAGGETFFQDRRYDGRSRFSIGGDGKNPPKATSLRIDDQTDTRDRYEGEQCNVTWLMMFRELFVSQPLYTYIDQGARLDITRDGDRPRVVLVLRRYGSEMTYDLDPEHDYLPRAVGGLFRIQVTRFARVDGIWFPVEGIGPPGNPTGVLGDSRWSASGSTSRSPRRDSPCRPSWRTRRGPCLAPRGASVPTRWPEPGPIPRTPRPSRCWSK